MGFFGSGDKVQSATDARIGLSDNAVLVQPGGFIFNPGQPAANTTAVQTTATKSNAVVISLIAAVLVIALVLLWRKKNG